MSSTTDTPKFQIQSQAGPKGPQLEVGASCL